MNAPMPVVPHLGGNRNEEDPDREHDARVVAGHGGLQSGREQGSACRQYRRPRSAGRAGRARRGRRSSAEVQGQAQQNFTVINNTGHIVMTLNVSPSNEDSWGPDILGASVIANGKSAQVTFERGQSQCQWDIRVTYDDGDTSDMRGVNLCQVATVTLTP